MLVFWYDQFMNLRLLGLVAAFCNWAFQATALMAAYFS
jgi:hypothetical protein